jgi:hypothetical protein
MTSRRNTHAYQHKPDRAHTYNSYTAANKKIADSVAKLSSGYAINSAPTNAPTRDLRKDARPIRASTKRFEQPDAISLVHTAEGALSSACEILQECGLSVHPHPTPTRTDRREALQSEFSQLQSELDEISKTPPSITRISRRVPFKSNKYVYIQPLTGLNRSRRQPMPARTQSPLPSTPLCPAS